MTQELVEPHPGILWQSYTSPSHAFQGTYFLLVQRLLQKCSTNIDSWTPEASAAGTSLRNATVSRALERNSVTKKPSRSGFQTHLPSPLVALDSAQSWVNRLTSINLNMTLSEGWGLRVSGRAWRDLLRTEFSYVSCTLDNTANYEILSLSRCWHSHLKSKATEA